MTVDLQVIERLRQLDGGRGEALTKLVDLFSSHSAAVLAQLRGAAEAGDTQLVERLAHSLKGSAGNLGAREMMELCAQLESEARAGRTADLASRTSTLEASYERARSRLVAALQGPGSAPQT